MTAPLDLEGIKARLAEQEDMEHALGSDACDTQQSHDIRILLDEVERLNQRVVDAQACATVLADEVDRLTQERGQMVETIRTARQALKNGSHDAAFAILDSSLDAEPEPAP